MDISRSHDGEVFQGAGGGFSGRGGDPGGAALGDNDAARARGVRGPDDGAQVMGVLNAVENNQQTACQHGIPFSVSD
jgi:hypothetical protein